MISIGGQFTLKSPGREPPPTHSRPSAHDNDRSYLYYDGVRRIQTVDDNATPANTADDLTQHEYVYGPEYVDEFVLQSQRAVVGEQVVQKSFYMLQDGNYNVMALLDDTGAVVEQYQWEPYGSLATLDTTASPRPDNSIGHQGLFFYRFDGADSLSLNAVGLYHNRNRWYSPSLGRFTSRDPIETAQLIVSAAVRNAQAFLILAGAFNDAGHFSNGMNLFQYANSNPVGNRDPGGLDWWDDEIDNQISDLTGNKLYALGMINDMSRNVGLGLRTALSVASALLPGAGLYDAFNSVVAIANGSSGFWDAINIAMAAIPAAKAASKLIGMSSLVKAMGYASRACNCFVAGTLVDTPWGVRPIEEIEPGDEVMTCPQDEPGSPPRPGRVTRVFRNLAPVILWLSLSNGWEVGTTPGHEVWTYQDGWTSAGNLETGDMFIGSDGQPVEVLAIRVDPTPTLVYNLEVDGTFTYYAADVWVHNNSCEVGRQLLFHMHHALAKFLGGFDDGIKVLLSETMHKKYHGGLLQRLSQKGIYPKRGQKWLDYFADRKNAGKQQAALDAMVDYTREFDSANGTGLLQYVLQQLSAQGAR